jgi:hypothetical protein
MVELLQWDSGAGNIDLFIPSLLAALALASEALKKPDAID